MLIEIFASHASTLCSHDTDSCHNKVFVAPHDIQEKECRARGLEWTKETARNMSSKLWRGRHIVSLVPLDHSVRLPASLNLRICCKLKQRPGNDMGCDFIPRCKEDCSIHSNCGRAKQCAGWARGLGSGKTSVKLPAYLNFRICCKLKQRPSNRMRCGFIPRCKEDSSIHGNGGRMNRAACSVVHKTAETSP
jgi:hypothetical protein